MVWLDELLSRLEKTPRCGYYADSVPATEPTALAALALLGHGRREAAVTALDWLADVQQPDGSLGIDGATSRPSWPTGWALLAWRTGLAGPWPTGAPARWAAGAQKATGWLLAVRGRSQQPSELFGHNTLIQGWPWVQETQSWVEPTAISLLALKRSGQQIHPRCREAVAMLLNRMLPQGGWNYGNTVVLGATLKAHVQPTGLALAALAGEPDAAQHVRRSLEYLNQALSARTTAASLAYGVIGAGAHGQRPAAAEAWLEAAYRRTVARDASPHRLALLALAAGNTLGPKH